MKMEETKILAIKELGSNSISEWPAVKFSPAYFLLVSSILELVYNGLRF